MKDLHAELQKLIQVRQIPAVSLRVLKDGSDVIKFDLGLSNLSYNQSLTSKHLFPIGSLTKPIMANAISLLVELGKVDLSKPISYYLSELRGCAQFDLMLVAHLLNNTSGLARGSYFSHKLSDLDCLQSIRESSLSFVPGEKFKYSNLGYFLLGKVIESVTGCSAESFIEREIFDVCGMKNSHFKRNTDHHSAFMTSGYWSGWQFGSPDLAESPYEHPQAMLPNCAAGMVSNTDDYIKWLSGFINIDEDAVSIESRARQRLLRPRYKMGRNYYSNFGLFVENIDSVPFHFFAGIRSGCSSFMFIIPSLNLTGVAMGNLGACTDELRELLYQVCREHFIEDGLPLFGLVEKKFSIRAKSGCGTSIRVTANVSQKTHAIKAGNEISLHPYSSNSFFQLTGECRTDMLRVAGAETGDAVVSLGNQIFYEDDKRIKNQKRGASHFEEFCGLYRYPPFGKLKIIQREGKIYISFGVIYETILEQVSELDFKQLTGPFRYELIRFERNQDSKKIISFKLDNMRFERERQYST